MKTQCDICNRSIEEHLQTQKKRLCFSCLTEEVSDGGAIPTFNIKQKPVHASCAICDAETSGPDLVPSPWGFICNHCCDMCETQTGVPWEMVRLAAQNEWLVRSNGKVLGPFSVDDVEGKLRSNVLVPHDEISRALGRWKLVRDEDQFRLVLNEIRHRHSSKGQGDLENTDSGTITDTEGITMPIDLSVDRPFLKTEKLMEGVQLHKEREALPAKETQKSRDLLKSYASKEDQRIRRELKITHQGRLWLALVILLVTSVFALLKITRTPLGGQGARNQSFQELMQVALRAEKVGDYPKAMAAFSEARTLKPNDSEMLLHLAPLVLFYDRQALQAQRMFKEILETERGANYQKTAYLGLGLIALLSHELDAAKENFNNTLKLDADHAQAYANLGIVSYFKDELDSAQSSLLTAMDKKKGPTDGAVLISLVDVAIALSEKDKSQANGLLNSAHESMTRYLQHFHDYQQEVLVQDARVLSLQNHNAEAGKRIQALLDVDPEKTDLHIHDWGVYRERASWGLLLESLKKVATELPATPRLTAALGLAMYRGREKLDGAQSLEQALVQAPQDPLLLALAGWVQLKLGRRDTGVVNIKQAASVANGKVKLPYILLARLCAEERDFSCAKQNWDQVLKIDQNSIEAMHGMGQIEWARKNADAALTWVKQGQAFDSMYIPLLKLSQEIQSVQNAGGEL